MKKLLLDTHALLWWLNGDKTLSKEAAIEIASTNNVVYISSASIWEIMIKSTIGKLSIPDSFKGIIDTSPFRQLNIMMEHTYYLQRLPDIHRDPFDRMLIAQAMCENCTLVTRDPMIAEYAVPQIKA